MNARICSLIVHKQCRISVQDSHLGIPLKYKIAGQDLNKISTDVPRGTSVDYFPVGMIAGSSWRAFHGEHLRDLRYVPRGTSVENYRAATAWFNAFSKTFPFLLHF